MIVRDDHTKVLDPFLLKLALVRTKVEAVLPQTFQDHPRDAAVFFARLGVDEDVVEVD